MKALCTNKPDFVELLLENGIAMSKYYDVRILEEVYSAVSFIFQVSLLGKTLRKSYGTNLVSR